MSNQPELRLRIETAIEGLLALLDTVDGDENLEDTGDYEPYMSAGAQNWVVVGGEDLELDEGYNDTNESFIAGGQGL